MGGALVKLYRYAHLSDTAFGIIDPLRRAEYLRRNVGNSADNAARVVKTKKRAAQDRHQRHS